MKIFYELFHFHEEFICCVIDLGQNVPIFNTGSRIYVWRTTFNNTERAIPENIYIFLETIFSGTIRPAERSVIENENQVFNVRKV